MKLFKILTFIPAALFVLIATIVLLVLTVTKFIIQFACSCGADVVVTICDFYQD